VSAPSVDYAARREELRRRYIQPRATRPVSTARGVHHLALICSDVTQTIEFYQGLLGFPLIELVENRDYAGSNHLFFDLGHGNLLAFFDFPGLDLKPGVESFGSVQHLAISVEPAQFEALKARLDAAGIAYLGPDRGITSSVYFRDPDGIQLELLREPLLRMDERPLGE
jgi:glyoxylase I family protein